VVISVEVWSKSAARKL